MHTHAKNENSQIESISYARGKYPTDTDFQKSKIGEDIKNCHIHKEKT